MNSNVELITALKAATRLIQQDNDIEKSKFNTKLNGLNYSNKSQLVLNGSNAHDKDKEVLKVLKELFDSFDIDGNGKINSRELDRGLTRLNVSISSEAINKLLRSADFNRSRDIDFNEFLLIMSPVFDGKFNDNELINAFNKYDTDQSGYITYDELQKMLAKIGRNYSDEELKRILSLGDLNNDGKLDFNEFSRLMRSDF